MWYIVSGGFWKGHMDKTLNLPCSNSSMLPFIINFINLVYFVYFPYILMLNNR